MMSLGRHYVYRIWNSDGVLIWIGATSQLTSRLMDHLKHRDVGEWAATEYDTRPEAFAAERAAIAVEQPRDNRLSKGARA